MIGHEARLVKGKNVTRKPDNTPGSAATKRQWLESEIQADRAAKTKAVEEAAQRLANQYLEACDVLHESGLNIDATPLGPDGCFYYTELLGAILRSTIKSVASESTQALAVSAMRRIAAAVESISTDAWRNKLDEELTTAIVSSDTSTVRGKQVLASTINDIIRDNRGILVTPGEKQEACILLAINDKYGGRFLYSTKESKRRVGSNKDIRHMLPFLIQWPSTVIVHVACCGSIAAKDALHPGIFVDLDALARGSRGQ